MDLVSWLREPVFWIIFLPILVFVILPWLRTCVMMVEQHTAAVTEVFGRFAAVKHAGLRFKLPWPISLERRMPDGNRVSLRLRELRETVSVKTTDNVFVVFPVAVQYRVMRGRVREAFYELENPPKQIASFVLNVIRTEGAKMNLEELYTAKQSVEDAVKTDLAPRMESYGYEIVSVLVDQPQPTQDVQESFNRVIAAQREMEAARNLAEAERIHRVGIALAEKESKRLQGEGIAAQRLAIAEGYREAMNKLTESMPGVSEETILAMLMMTNHWDTIRDASDNPASVILLNGSGEEAMKEMARLAAAFKSLQRN